VFATMPLRMALGLENVVVHNTINSVHPVRVFYSTLINYLVTQKEGNFLNS
jgi:hypothetical protein